ncbi:methylated-dna--protein-cysteine methyltransferase [Holotrichia oblita]|nr:methylated-dna--protein-cysteine methyltransferase [Holotrichia oblita]
MNYIWFYDYPIGRIGIVEKDFRISNIFFFCGKAPNELFKDLETELIKKTSVQLREYFEGKRAVFDVPLYITGTNFQISVMNALMDIPYGQTRTYKDIAESIGNNKACRAVGMANNRNPIAIIVPCHRVIGKNKSLTGYAGGLETKKYLLELEKEYYYNFNLNYTC